MSKYQIRAHHSSLSWTVNITCKSQSRRAVFSGINRNNVWFSSAMTKSEISVTYCICKLLAQQKATVADEAKVMVLLQLVCHNYFVLRWKKLYFLTTTVAWITHMPYHDHTSYNALEAIDPLNHSGWMYCTRTKSQEKEKVFRFPCLFLL